jgi:small-conductance mechanosensitive channel
MDLNLTFLPDDFLGSSIIGGIFFLSIFLGSFVVAFVVFVILKHIANRLFSGNPGSVLSEILHSVRKSVFVLILLVGLSFSLTVGGNFENQLSEIIYDFSGFIKIILLMISIILVSHSMVCVIGIFLKWYLENIAEKTATTLDDQLVRPLMRLTPVVIYSIGTLVLLESLGISISPLLAGLGIAGLAVALAVQPSLTNFLAGTYVMTESQLKIGDYIELPDGTAGFVIEIGWRSTKLRSILNNLLIVPNSTISNSVILNYYSPSPALNVRVVCGVSYDSDLEQVERVTLEECKRVQSESESAIKDQDPRFGFDSFDDSNISFWVFMQATDRLGSFALTSEIIKAIHARFILEEITINYPVRTLQFPEDIKSDLFKRQT